jgi:hypothetical protein
MGNTLDNATQIIRAVETHKSAAVFLSFTATLGSAGPCVGHGHGLHRASSSNDWDGDDGVVGYDHVG